MGPSWPSFPIGTTIEAYHCLCLEASIPSIRLSSTHTIHSITLDNFQLTTCTGYKFSAIPLHLSSSTSTFQLYLIVIVIIPDSHYSYLVANLHNGIMGECAFECKLKHSIVA